MQPMIPRPERRPPPEMAENGHTGQSYADETEKMRREDSQYAAPPVARERRLPKRIVWITLKKPYEEFRIRAWVNYPVRMLDEANKFLTDIPSPNEQGIEDEEKERRESLQEAGRLRQAQVLSEIILEHDLVDFEGVPLPPSHDPAFWSFVLGELQAVIFDAIANEMGKLSPTKRGR